MCTLISQQQENFITCEKKSCLKTNDLLERRNEHVIDSFIACLCKNHLASKILKSWFKSKKKQMLYADTVREETWVANWAETNLRAMNKPHLFSVPTQQK